MSGDMLGMARGGVRLGGGGGKVGAFIREGNVGRRAVRRSIVEDRGSGRANASCFGWGERSWVTAGLSRWTKEFQESFNFSRRSQSMR